MEINMMSSLIVSRVNPKYWESYTTRSKRTFRGNQYNIHPKVLDTDSTKDSSVGARLMLSTILPMDADEFSRHLLECIDWCDKLNTRVLFFFLNSLFVLIY